MASMQLGGHIATAFAESAQEYAIPSRHQFAIPREDVAAARAHADFTVYRFLLASACVAANHSRLRSLVSFAVRRISIERLTWQSRHFFVRCLVVALFAAALCVNLFAQAPSEYDVKAAYLYNFGKFVKWPQDSTKGPQFLICVLGDNPFNGSLQSVVAGEKVNGKPATVVDLNSARDASPCNILYISRSEERRARHILESIDVRGTLTVSDIPGFLDDGGMIQFVNEGGRIRFDINVAAAQQAGLNLSSELLKVANAVRGHP